MTNPCQDFVPAKKRIAKKADLQKPARNLTRGLEGMADSQEQLFARVQQLIAQDCFTSEQRDTLSQLLQAHARSQEQLERQGQKLAHLEQMNQHTLRMLRFAAKGAEIFLWEWNYRLGTLAWIPQDAPFLGFAPDEYDSSLDWVMQRLTPEGAKRFEQLVQRDMPADESLFELSLPLFAWDGEVMWCEVRGSVIARDEDGQPLLLTGTARDITRQHDAEEQLRLERDLATQLNAARTIDQVLQSLFAVLLSVETINACVLYMLSSDEEGLDIVQHRNLPREFVDRVSHLSLEHPLVQKVQNEGMYSSTLEQSRDYFVQADYLAGMRAITLLPIFGNKRLMGILGVGSTSADEFPPYIRQLFESMQGMISNVVLRSIVERDLRHSEEKYRTLTNNITAGIFRTTPGSKGSFIEVNDTMLELFKIPSRRHLDGLHVSDLYEDSDERALVNKQLLEKGAVRNQEVQLRRWSGEVFWATITAVAVRDQQGHVRYFDGVLQDVTEQKRAVESMRESEEKFRTISEQSLMAILILQDGFVRYGNSSFYAQSLYTRQEVRAWRQNEYIKLLHPDYRDTMVQQMHKKLQGAPDAEPSYDFIGLRKDGEEVWLELYSRPIPFRGRPAVLVVLLDINQRKQALAKLGRSERRFRALFEKNDSIMMLIEKDTGRIREANTAAQRFYGYPINRLEQMCVQDLIVMPDGGTMPRTSALKNTRFAQVRHRLCNGDLREVEVRNTHIQQGGRDILFSIVNDVTERRRMEEEIAKRQKLEAIGLLAGGIAHDFNNILMAILGNVSLIKQKLPEAATEMNYVKNAEKGIERAKKLSGQLLTFAKGGAPIRETASVRDLLEDCSRFVLRGSSTACRRDIAPDLRNVHMDTGQMSQVIQNLILNAQQAMPEGGEVTLSACNEQLDALHGTGLSAGPYVRIDVRDEGIGIAPDRVGSVFDPYYTTKEMGTGLGLSIVYSIVKRHDGAISLESEQGVGTTFHLWLPAVEEKVEARPANDGDTAFGKGLILFMDDEQMVRETAGALLKYLGYEVVYATRGKEALQVYKEHMSGGQPIDLVILDLTIPGGMGGVDTMKQLLALDPKAKGIVVSGFAHNRVMLECHEAGFRGSISKPFVLNEFSQIIARVLKEDD